MDSVSRFFATARRSPRLFYGTLTAAVTAVTLIVVGVGVVLPANARDEAARHDALETSTAQAQDVAAAADARDEATFLSAQLTKAAVDLAAAGLGDAPERVAALDEAKRLTALGESNASAAAADTDMLRQAITDGEAALADAQKVLGAALLADARSKHQDAVGRAAATLEAVSVLLTENADKVSDLDTLTALTAALETLKTQQSRAASKTTAEWFTAQADLIVNADTAVQTAIEAVKASHEVWLKAQVPHVPSHIPVVTWSACDGYAMWEMSDGKITQHRTQCAVAAQVHQMIVDAGVDGVAPDETCTEYGRLSSISRSQLVSFAQSVPDARFTVAQVDDVTVEVVAFTCPVGP